MNIVKKAVSALLALSFVVAATGSCTVNKKDTVYITVGSMFYDDMDISFNDSHIWMEQKERIKRFEKKYPNIKIIPSTYEYNEDNFVALSAAKQIPTFFRTWFTEVRKISRAGLAVDVSDIYNKSGYDKYLSEDIKNVIAPDGKYYGFPADIYSKGIMINAKLFKEAGLVNEDGSPVIPKTWDELVKFAVIIKDKTGASGFTLQGGDKNPGWDFMNIAWSYGVNFVEEQPDGKAKAIFDTPEMRKAVHLLYDMKWKYDVLLNDGLSSKPDLHFEFANNRLAMAFSDVNTFDVIRTYNQEPDFVAKAHTPAGPAGRKELLGGGVYMISSEATPEQIDACVKWAEFNGYTPEVNDDVVKCWHSMFENHKALNYVIGIKDPEIWTNPEWNKKHTEVLNKYVNVDEKYYKDYNDFSNVDLVTEEQNYPQELYRILSILIQEVLTNKNCDIDALIKKANSDFQNNYLNLVG